MRGKARGEATMKSTRQAPRNPRKQTLIIRRQIMQNLLQKRSHHLWLQWKLRKLLRQQNPKAEKSLGKLLLRQTLVLNDDDDDDDVLQLKERLAAYNVDSSPDQSAVIEIEENSGSASTSASIEETIEVAPARARPQRVPIFDGSTSEWVKAIEQVGLKVATDQCGNSCEKMTGIISPSKLRMKLIGPHHLRKKDGSNSNSSRTSPSKLEDHDFVNSLLASKNGDFDEEGSHSISGQAYGGNAVTDPCPQNEDLKEIGHSDLPFTKSSTGDTTGIPAIRSVSMRDMGTEMTPATSQEPSRTATPVGATTPLRSPTSSIPSTPRGGAPASKPPKEHNTDDESQNPTERTKKELSEEELKLKTRREIVALGVQLGKMNIAAWASKDEQGKKRPCNESFDIKELERIEYEKCAAAWEDAEKSKHMARYKREEIKIQAWESQQRAKLEAEMRRIEIKGKASYGSFCQSSLPIVVCLEMNA
uniref:Remorin C-terminal domain-containing protein n=1 Tax=Quercus lobata TaxID=97700 RepID=A0A7N2KUU9_QUELO